MTVVMPVWSDLQNLNYQIPCRFCRSSIKHKVFPAKCKNVDRLINFPTAPMFGCKQPFLVRPRCVLDSLRCHSSQGHCQDQLFLLFRYIVVVSSHCMCCGNLVERIMVLFTECVRSVYRRNLKKGNCSGSPAKNGCLQLVYNQT